MNSERKEQTEKAEPRKSSLGKDAFWTALIIALKKLQPILAKVNPWLGWIALVLYGVLEYFLGR